MQIHTKLDFLQLKSGKENSIKIAPLIWGAIFFLFSSISFSFKYNIILISIDTLRPDYLGFMGGNPSPSPFLDLISKNSVIFKNAVTPVPLTLPSHLSMLTGLYPFNHKIRDNGREGLSKEIYTLQKFLKSKGFNTYAVIGSYVLSSRFGLSEAFDIYDDFVYKDGEQKLAFAFQERLAKTVSENVLKIFRKIEKNNPYFFFIHFFDPHAPYKRHYISRKLNDYQEEIAFVDLNIKKLFYEMDDGKTIWIFVSDHGEAFGEHNEYTHGFLTYESTLKVLFMIYAPFFFQSKIINERVSLTDIFPTVADIFGDKIKCDGESLLELINGKKILKNRNLLFESFYSYNNFTELPIFGIYIGDYKIILPEPYEVYNLSVDQKEAKNIASEKKDLIRKAKELTNVILNFNEKEQKDIESKRILRSLGYLTSSNQSKKSNLSPKKVFSMYSEISKFRDNYFSKKSEFPFKEYENFLKEFPKCAILCMELAMGFYKEGIIDKAIFWLNEAIKNDPYMIEAWHDLGNVYYGLKDIEKAEFYYRKVIEIDQDFPYSYLSLGKIYYDKGEIEKAKEYWEKFMELDPRDDNVPKIRKLLKIGG